MRRAKRMSIVNTLWKSERCPYRTGVYRPDDTVTWLEVSMEWTFREGGWVHVDVIGRGRVERGMNGDIGDVAEITRMNERIYPELDLRISCGEGGHGSVGFIAVSKASTDDLVWLAFFGNSNPFVSASLEGDEVVVISNHGHIWHLPLNNPEGMFVAVNPR